MTDDSGKPEEEARALLDRLGSERKKLEAKLEDVQKETHDAIVDVLMARTLGPSEVARRVQYDRQHVARIAKKANVPPLREATVVSRREAQKGTRRTSAATPRQQVRQAVPEPEYGGVELVVARSCAEMAYDIATPAQLRRLDQAKAKAKNGQQDYAVADAAYSMGLISDADIAAARKG